MPRLRSNVVALTRPTSAMTTGQALVTPAYAATRLGAAPVQRGDLISARVRAGRFPPPMSRVWVDCHSPSDWEVVDTVTPPAAAYHDDFVQLNYAAGILSADTTWGVNDTSGGAGAILQTNLLSGIGVMSVVTSPANGNAMVVQKDATSILLNTDYAVWMSWRMAMGSTAQIASYVGLTDVLVRFDTSLGDTTYKLSTLAGNLLNLVTAPTTDVYNTFDLVVMPDQFAAAWIDGDGPYVQTAGIPTTGTSERALHQVNNYVAATKNFVIDWSHVETFLEPVHPTLLYS